MSKTAIKNFAIWAHCELLKLTKEQIVLRHQQPEGQADEQLAEQISYTWFHRLVALRYLEVNGYLKSGMPEDGAVSPNAKESQQCGVMCLEELCRQTDKSDARRSLTAACNALSEGLPMLFPAVNTQTEILLSEEIFRPQGLVVRLVTDIPREEWINSVEIIGWLHQYYNTEQKSRVFDELQKSNVKISKERIPAVTQLFTPDWIVHYMVDRAMDGIWKDIKNNDACCRTNGDLKQAQKERLRNRLAELRFLDPCMGSGHILVYAFEVLMGMYRICGVDDAKAVRLILKKNLFGMDIDQKAAQLSCFSLMMKARQYDANILAEGIQPHVYVISDSRFLTLPLIDFVAKEYPEWKCDLMTLAEDLYDAAEYGSLTNLRPIDLKALLTRTAEIENTYYADVVESLYAQQVKEKLTPLLLQAGVMTQSYDVVVTNPPYMGKSAMDKKLRAYVKKQYPLSNHDLFAVFIEKCDAMLSDGGYLGMITQHSWMFLKSYERLRRRILSSRTIVHMLHLGTRAFEEISGEVVQTVTWVMKKTDVSKQSGTYMRLVDFGNDKERVYREECETGKHHITYVRDNADFFRIPGAPVAYWVPESAMHLFETTTAADFAVVTNGMFTCDNRRFLRFWYEVPREEIAFDCSSKYECIAGGKKWFPYNKGGNFCRWYGNHEYVINFENFGEEIRNYRIQSGQSAVFPGQEHYFEPSLSWSLVSPKKFGIRYYPPGFVFDIAGSSIFPIRSEHMMPMLAVLASEPTLSFLKVLNPTINYQAGDIRSLPMPEGCLKNEELGALAEENVRIAKELWDSKETSWEFQMHPLVRAAKQMRKAGAAAADKEGAVLLADCIEQVLHTEEEQRIRLAANEARINELVSEAYGFGEAALKDAATKEKTCTAALCKELLSYAVGCMFGRYESICEPTRTSLLYLTEEDFIVRLRMLLSDWFGKATIEENLCFAASCLGKSRKLPAHAVLTYMQKDFYREHERMYRKHPVYWQLKAPAKSALCPALLYAHRYQPADIRAYWPEERPAPELDLEAGTEENRKRLAGVLRG